MTKQAPKAVIFDFGGVLGAPLSGARKQAMAALCGIPLERFMPLYERDRLELDRGSLEPREYWRRLALAAGAEPSDERIAGLSREDTLGWTVVNRTVVRWSAELREAGFLTGILSNMPPDKLAYMRGSDDFRWIGDFPVVVFSCECSLVKPEPAIYRLCLERLGVQPADALFLDDLPRNVDAGRAVGIPGLVFRSPGESADALEREWHLPVKALREPRA